MMTGVLDEGVPATYGAGRGARRMKAKRGEEDRRKLKVPDETPQAGASGTLMGTDLAFFEAHRRELLGPLMVLDNALEILDTEYPDRTAAEFSHVLGTARRTARRMRTLMEDLLSAGAIQSGHFVVAPHRTSFRTIVDDAIEIVSPS